MRSEIQYADLEEMGRRFDASVRNLGYNELPEVYQNESGRLLAHLAIGGFVMVVCTVDVAEELFGLKFFPEPKLSLGVVMKALTGQNDNERNQLLGGFQITNESGRRIVVFSSRVFACQLEV